MALQIIPEWIVNLDDEDVSFIKRLSVITPKPYTERVKRTVYPKKRTQRDELCAAIDQALRQKPKNFEELVQLLADMGYEYKDAFNQLGVTKLPSRKQLSIEFNELLVAKKEAYAEYRRVRDDIKEYHIAKRAMDVILGKDRQQQEEAEKEKRQER